MASVGVFVDGNQDVGFGKVGGGASARHVVGDDIELRSHPFDAVVSAHQVDGLPLNESRVVHIEGVEEDDATGVFDAPVAVIIGVDGGVELVVTSDGHHQILAIVERMLRDGMNRKFCLSRVRGKLAVSYGVGKRKAARFSNPLIIEFKTIDDVFDQVTDTVVVGDQFLPGHRGSIAQGSLGHGGDDGWLAQQLRGGRRESAARRVDDAHRVFDGDKLAAPGLFVDFGATQTGEN